MAKKPKAGSDPTDDDQTQDDSAPPASGPAAAAEPESTDGAEQVQGEEPAKAQPERPPEEPEYRKMTPEEVEEAQRSAWETRLNVARDERISQACRDHPAVQDLRDERDRLLKENADLKAQIKKAKGG